MKFLLVILTLVLSASSTFAQKSNKVKESETGTYGAPISKTMTVLPLEQVVDDKVFNKTCQVTAKVEDVCSAAGCWIVLKDGDAEVRVTFKDYGFFVPSALKGTKVVVEGVLSETVTTEADRKHYAEDSGASKEEIDAIKGDKRELAFEAIGVEKRKQ